MKTCSTISLFTIVIGTAVTAKRPQFSINIQDGNFQNVAAGLNPTLSWSNSCTTIPVTPYGGNIDLEYGFEASAPLPTSTTDITSLLSKNTKVWGKVSKSPGLGKSGWDLSTRAEMSGMDLDLSHLNVVNLDVDIDVDVDAVNKEHDLSFHLDAEATTNAAPTTTTNRPFQVFKKVQATKGFHINGYRQRITVNPRYNLYAKQGDIVLAYNNNRNNNNKGTDIKVTVSKDEQSVTLSQRINEENTIAPTLTSNGDFSLEWDRKINKENNVITTWKQKESVIDIQWKDSKWTANINLPLDGTDIKETNVSVKRAVSF